MASSGERKRVVAGLSAIVAVAACGEPGDPAAGPAPDPSPTRSATVAASAVQPQPGDQLAAELPETFAAIAPVSGGLIGTEAAEDPAGSVPDTAVSLITFIGAEDSYADGFQRGVDTWRRQMAAIRSIRDLTLEATP